MRSKLNIFPLAYLLANHSYTILRSYFTNDFDETLQFYLVNVRSNASNMPQCMLFSFPVVSIGLRICEKCLSLCDTLAL